MPVYQFRCHACSVIFERFFQIEEYEEFMQQEPNCPDCGRHLKRMFSFASKVDFVPHYNSSLGTYVNTKREMLNTLRGLEVEAENRLGYPAKYALHDPRDLDYTVTEEGMDETHRHQAKTGQLEVRKWF